MEQVRDLVAVHGLTEQNLRGALRLGGLPMPSIAVVKAAQGHSKYGPISMAFGRESIDPQVTTGIKTYGRGCLHTDSTGGGISGELRPDARHGKPNL